MCCVCACMPPSAGVVGAADPDADCHEGEDDGATDCHGTHQDLLLQRLLCTRYFWTHSRVRG